MSRPGRKPGRGRVPKPKWVLLAVAVAMMGSILALNGWVNPKVSADAERQAPRAPIDKVPVSVLDGGSVVDATHGQVHSIGYPSKTLALTFDDGPDPQWTPQILDVLQRYEVPGTFFVLGSLGAQHPDLLREIVDSGSEIGIHTFTHPDLTTVSQDRLTREIDQTQLVIAGATGQVSYLVRPPYSSEVLALDNNQYSVVRELGDRGFVTAFTDIDSRDWERKGVDSIVAAATPANGAGGAILMHDAGGDRSETVAALDRLIPELKAQGYTFTTVTKGVGLPPADQAASTSDHNLGLGLVTGVSVATWFVRVFEIALLVLGLLVIARLVLVLVVAVVHRRRARRAEAHPQMAPVTEPVSVIIPAYNEKECIAATVRAVAASDHPVEIIVVDDGSTDGTADIVEALDIPGVRLIRQANAGKPAALNNGVRAASHEIVVMLDGDTIFEVDTARLLAQPFADPSVGAVAGNAKVANRTSLVTRWQHIEYVIGFNLDRRMQDVFGCITTVPGAVGAFRRTALLTVGGVSDDTLAEDTDLTMALGIAGRRVVYEERARAWTEAPSTFGQLWRQRYRWSYGTIQSLWKHRGALRTRGPGGRYARRGLLNLGIFQVLLPLIAPLIDILLVYGLIFDDTVRTLVLWGAVLAIQTVAGIVAFRLEREKMAILWLLPLQQFAYRQLMYAVLIQSVSAALTGIRLGWQKLRRIGRFENVPPQDRDRALSAPAAHASPDPAPVDPEAPSPAPAAHAPRSPHPAQVPVSARAGQVPVPRRPMPGPSAPEPRRQVASTPGPTPVRATRVAAPPVPAPPVPAARVPAAPVPTPRVPVAPEPPLRRPTPARLPRPRHDAGEPLTVAMPTVAPSPGEPPTTQLPSVTPRPDVAGGGAGTGDRGLPRPRRATPARPR
ncbi:bifunctional polysaccharide deacetylase/glycosyltransferase family 2 protein [Pseudonocardia dioxanivorans]|uniref:bifunctional polysaccharide deacetylase/glycosyltransferase family 2 protein n=1 Tax=Pseudonocardia dioxanivorans TaxID=240495 RepID=UPI000CD06A9F|nr:bifunctional polysaccharide deacetylase/glycosyltransferase family 2 protein [Pseudonocardia dioxanivorans]